MNIVTHSGKFHADELIACSILRMVFPEVEIIRTRNLSITKEDDFLVDVGNVYDPAMGQFDHHQKDAPKRPNSKFYSSAGLVWEHYGRTAIVHTVSKEILIGQLQKIWEDIDDRFMAAIDAIDSGETPTADSMSFSASLGSFNILSETIGEDEAFKAALVFAKQVLANTILSITQQVVEADYVRMADRYLGGKLLILNRGVPWIEVVTTEPEFANVEFVMFPHIDGATWRLQAVPKETGSFEKRRSLPDVWAGLSGQDLEQVSGVRGAVFCHKALFICGADSKESMFNMAKLAVS